jgi:phosphoglycolate phosphatase-like HAD superfamily hydrolase
MVMRCAVLFDIDGTLLRTSGAGAKALTHALVTELEVEHDRVHAAMSTVDFRGATDRAILRKLGDALDVALEPRQESLLGHYLLALEHHLANAHVEVLPGVNELLAALGLRTDVYVGILTGNIRSAARLKLGAIGHAGLVERAGGFGEDGMRRQDLAAVARERLFAAGVTPSARIIVVGDTEHDVSCGKHIGAYTVAVATGWTARETLFAAGPDMFLDDLSVHDAFLELLG